MKKIYLLLALLCVFVLFAGCNGGKAEAQKSEEDVKWDHRPMVYFKDELYGETADFLTELPDGLKLAGEIQTEGDQTEPMKHEDGYSNSLPAGSKIYAADDENIIYIAIVHPSKGEGYITYEQLDE